MQHTSFIIISVEFGDFVVDTFFEVFVRHELGYGVLEKVVVETVVSAFVVLVYQLDKVIFLQDVKNLEKMDLIIGSYVEKSWT